MKTFLGLAIQKRAKGMNRLTNFAANQSQTLVKAATHGMNHG